MFKLNPLISIVINKTISSSICCFLLLFLYSVSSQNPIQETSLYMSQLGVNEGLSAGGINSVAEDNEGYLWFSTPDGLNRYDGYRVKKYLNEPNNSSSLLSSYIDRVFVDSRGWIWVLTRSGGIHVYNKKRDNFIRIPIQKTQTVLFEDQHGDIWCQTTPNNYNLISFNKEHDGDFQSDLTLDDITIKNWKEAYPNLPEANGTRKIAYSKNSGLWIYESNTLFNYNLIKEKKNAELLFQIAIEDIDDIQLITNPNNDQILLSGSSKILIVDGSQKKIIDSIPIPKEVGYSKTIELVDHKNRLWVLANNHVYRVDSNTKNWEEIKLQNEGPRKEFLKYAINLTQDSHNNIWIGTKGFGVFKHSITNEAFNYFGEDRAGPFIHTTRPYNDSSIIFSATDTDTAMQIFNYETNSVRGVFIPETTFIPLEPSSFNVFFKDSRERYWLPSKKNNDQGFKMLLLDKDLELLDEIKSPLYNDSKNSALITYVFETEDGQIWGVGSLSNETDEYPHVYLSKWSEENKQFIVESVFDDHPKNYNFNQCTSSLQTLDGNLWFGFQSGGLLKYNPNKKEWNHFLKGDSVTGLAGYNILSSHKSLNHPETNFWLGTRSGLIDFNFKKETFKIYNESNGLKNNVVYGILTDDKNNLWMSTNSGLCRFNPTNGHLTNFSIDDGIQSTEFNRWAYFQKKDGTLFFGGVGGLTWFHPKDLETRLDKSKIKITGFKLNNEVTDSLLLNRSNLELPYDQRLITFEFAKLNLTTANRNRYVYKLEKDSNPEEWLELGNQTKVTFTKLSPANYTFYISTYDTNGNIDSNQDTLAFSISKPWWGNNWLKFLLFVILVAIGCYIYFVKIKSKRKLDDLKNNISRDLHDEIGSTLSSIAMYGIIAENEITSNPLKAQKLIQKINTHSITSIESMNDIVWSLKPGNETLEKLINRIRYYLSEIEETGHWKTSIKHDNSVINCSLISSNMRNLFLVIKESINNAIKHSNGSKIDVRILLENNNKLIRVEIEDNGEGLDLEKTDFNDSNGLINMHQRAAELKGTLEFVSKEDKGLKVVLVFNRECRRIL